MGVGGDKAVNGGEDDAAVMLSGTTQSGVESDDAGREMGARRNPPMKQAKDGGDCTTLSDALSAPSAEDVGREQGICC